MAPDPLICPEPLCQKVYTQWGSFEKHLDKHLNNGRYRANLASFPAQPVRPPPRQVRHQSRPPLVRAQRRKRSHTPANRRRERSVSRKMDTQRLKFHCVRIASGQIASGTNGPKRDSDIVDLRSPSPAESTDVVLLSDFPPAIRARNREANLTSRGRFEVSPATESARSRNSPRPGSVARVIRKIIPLARPSTISLPINQYSSRSPTPEPIVQELPSQSAPYNSPSSQNSSSSPTKLGPCWATGSPTVSSRSPSPGADPTIDLDVLLQEGNAQSKDSDADVEDIDELESTTEAASDAGVEVLLATPSSAVRMKTELVLVDGDDDADDVVGCSPPTTIIQSDTEVEDEKPYGLRLAVGVDDFPSGDEGQWGYKPDENIASPFANLSPRKSRKVISSSPVSAYRQARASPSPGLNTTPKRVSMASTCKEPVTPTTSTDDMSAISRLLIPSPEVAPLQSAIKFDHHAGPSPHLDIAAMMDLLAHFRCPRASLFEEPKRDLPLNQQMLLHQAENLLKTVHASHEGAMYSDLVRNLQDLVKGLGQKEDTKCYSCAGRTLCCSLKGRG